MMLFINSRDMKMPVFLILELINMKEKVSVGGGVGVGDGVGVGVGVVGGGGCGGPHACRAARANQTLKHQAAVRPSALSCCPASLALGEPSGHGFPRWSAAGCLPSHMARRDHEMMPHRSCMVCLSERL